MQASYRKTATSPTIIGVRGKSTATGGRVDPATVLGKSRKTRRPNKREIARATKRASRHRNQKGN
jgi:hypothetical protein